MKLIGLTCQHCSAPLQVPIDARFVTCSHCGTQLAVRKTGSVAYTETLEAIDARTERMAEQIDDLQRRSQVAELDRQWDLDREQFYVTDKHGHRDLPTKSGSVVSGVILTVFGVIWTVFAANLGGGLFALFGVFFVAFGLWTAFRHYDKATAFERAEASYRRRREELTRESGSETDPPALP